ncbi:MAG: acetyl-CoA carboxylase biotin carboxyl carrier protein [Firmicutes bacterium]|jgi:acetyl-CoA carboxylase biotin carboxyl carrier protein|nr:acetyl-CoA carboxylase biotin carboxyl carrier protein [Bacillota bacterium]
MEFRQINDLIKTVDSTSITELEIEKEGFRIRVKKAHTNSAQIVEMENQPVPLIEELEPNCIEIHSPMVGTFYRAPAPDGSPYIQVGDRIEEGQVLFIIEAMKMMNEIESEYNGKVIRFLVENGEPVEYGQPLLVIECV